jgi:23S rRNA (adenine2030-N6)-methyltransferase
VFAYRHLFHAGNAADVFKHVLLARLMLALGKKEKPFFYLDTHAGTGRYDLSHPWARKNLEFENGIERIWHRSDLPAALKPYLQAVRAENANGKLRWYPGSPRIALRFMRTGDRMVLAELNREDFAALKELFGCERRVHPHLMDGYQALKAFLPPSERRGLVLLDSSFDRAGEFSRIVEALAGAHRRWATGSYATWYPLIERSALLAFERKVIATGMRKILKLELALNPDDWTLTARGSGMLVVNPPWGFDAEAKPLLDWLWRALSLQNEGRASVEWLVPE